MGNEMKYEQARIPKRFWGLDVEFFKKNGGYEPAYIETCDYINDLKNQRSDGTGLFFTGKPGTGKTYLACAVLQAVIDEGFTGLFLTMPHLINLHHKLRELKEAWSIMKDAEAYEEWVRRDNGMASLRSSIEFVVLDDVGKEHTTTTGYSQALFDDVFRTRYDNGLSTIITSNIDILNWDARYSEAMADFVSEACYSVAVQGESFRRRTD